MDNKVRLVRELLAWLFIRGRQARLSDKVSNIQNVIMGLWPPLEHPKRLESLLKDDEWNWVTENRYMYLEPIADLHILPVLTIGRANLGLSLPKFPIRVVLFLLDNNDELVSVAYRFETPEGKGLHDFYHAQLIREVDGRGTFPGAPSWLPTKQPSFALDAFDPFSLLICLLVSIYGLRYLDKFSTESFGPSIFKHVEEIMVLKRRRSERKFWEVRVPPPPMKTVIFETAYEEKEFKKKLAKKYRNRQGKPKPVAWDDYQKMPPHELLTI